VTAINPYPIVTIAAKELQDAKRHRWFVLFAVLFAGLAIMLSLAGFWGIGVIRFAGFSRTAVSLSNLVALIVPLMGLVVLKLGLTYHGFILFWRDGDDSRKPNLSVHPMWKHKHC